MDGKPLYEYARESIPLPRPIPSRACNVSIELVDFTPASRELNDGGHNYRWPEQTLSSEEKVVFKRLTEMVHKAQTSGPSKEAEPLVPDLDAEAVPETSPSGMRPASFTVRMTVTSGTYVRSIVNDIGLALGCAAHVVKLTRTRQGEFVLRSGKEEEQVVGESSAAVAPASEPVQISEEEAANDLPSTATVAPTKTADTTCIPWSVWERAIAERTETLAAEKREKEELQANGTSKEEIDMSYSKEAIAIKRKTGPLKQWEEEVLKKFVDVPVPNPGGHGFTPYGT